jgi:hypothetical protein
MATNSTDSRRIDHSKAYADGVMSTKGYLSTYDRERMVKAFEAGMAKQVELSKNDHLRSEPTAQAIAQNAEKAKAYDGVCRTLGIKNDIVGYVKRLGRIADKAVLGFLHSNGAQSLEASGEYKEMLESSSVPIPWESKMRLSVNLGYPKPPNDRTIRE